jgi:hypothetical protein
MSATLTTIATTVTATTHEVTAADAFGGFVALIVGIVSFLAISGLALSMTVGASKSPSTMAITALSGVLSVVIAVGLYVTLTGTHAHKLEDCGIATWDKLGGTLALIIGIVGVLALLGILVTTAMGAFGASKTPVSSWPMEQEQMFAGFDRRIQQTQSQAWLFGGSLAVLVFVFAFGVYKGVKPDIKDLSKDMNMSNLTKKSTKSNAATPKPDAPEAPKPEAPKPEAPKAPEAAPESK